MFWSKDVKLTGKQKVMQVLMDGEPHHALEFLRKKMHKFSTRISELKREGIDIEITPTRHHYKIYQLK